MIKHSPRKPINKGGGEKPSNKEGGEAELFLTPDPPRKLEKLGRNLGGGTSNMVIQKLGEKRDRTSAEESDTDSVTSGKYDVYRVKKTKREKSGEKNEKEINNPNIQMHELGSEGEMNEKETGRTCTRR